MFAGLVAAVFASGCASVTLSPDANSIYLQTWVVEGDVEEVSDSVAVAMSQQSSSLRQPLGNFGGAAQRIADRQDHPDWKVISAAPVAGDIWLKYRKPGGFPHDVVVHVHGDNPDKSIVRAVSRSRYRFFNFRQNRRILSQMTAMLEAYWSQHGLQAQPSVGQMPELNDLPIPEKSPEVETSPVDLQLNPPPQESP